MGSTGSGKGTLIAHIRRLHPEFVYPASCTTREMRAGDVEGDQYHFVSREEFERRINAGEMLEWAQFGENLYGSLKDAVLPPLEEGKIVLRELDVQGIRQIKKLLPADQIVVILIAVASWDELERRVKERAPISESELAKRKLRYEDELTFVSEANFVIQNGDGKLDEAKKQFEDIINSL